MQSSFEALHHKIKISTNPRNARPPSLRKGGWENTKKLSILCSNFGFRHLVGGKGIMIY